MILNKYVQMIFIYYIGGGDGEGGLPVSIQ